MIKFGLIFKLLKKELSKYERPFVSKWAEVVKNPYTTLISCIISLRTKDEVTADASLRLLKNRDSPEKVLRLNEKQIQKLIYPAGFYKTKAKTIRGVSKVLINRYGGKVPNDLDELIKLKGVGRKTANIVMTYGHFSKDHIAIDTHCHRIPNRLGWVKTKNPEETEFAIKKILPKRHYYDFNELFVQFGQFICVPISPFCSRCPISKHCKKVGVVRSR